MLTKRVLTEAEASLVKEIQKDEPTWDRAESVEVSLNTQTFLEYSCDTIMAKQEALHTPAISDNFDLAADTDCLWIAASVQMTDSVATSDHLGKDLPWWGHCHPGSQSNWYEAPQVNLLQGHLYPKSSCARPGQSMAEQSQCNCKAKLIVNGVWFDEAFPWVALFL